MMNGERVELSSVLDEGYVVPTLVMLTSAKCNKDPGTYYRVHLLLAGVSQFHRKKLEELAAPDFEISCLEVDTARYTGAHCPRTLTLAALLKFDLAELLPGLGKVLYLDGDMLIKGDLAELYGTDTDSYILAAVPDMQCMVETRLHERMGIACYVNSGVLLLNLRRMRDEHLSDRLLECKLSLSEEWKFADQDAFNAVCHKDTLLLPPCYNAMLPAWGSEAYNYSIEQINRFYGTSYANLRELADDAVVVHLAGMHRSRPWNVIHGAYGEVWEHYYRLSPLGNVELERQHGPVDYDERHEVVIRALGLPLFRVVEHLLGSDWYLFGLLRVAKVRRQSGLLSVRAFQIPLWSSRKRPLR